MSNYLFDGAEPNVDLRGTYEVAHQAALAAIMRMTTLSSMRSVDACGHVSMGAIKAVSRLQKAAWLLDAARGWFAAKARPEKVKPKGDGPPRAEFVPPTETSHAP